jgi:hypothetical protein
MLPSWPTGRLLAESVAAYNLRHPDAPLDVKTSEWNQLVAVVMSFVRHEFSDYDQERLQGADRGKLRKAIHSAAKIKYPWLRADSDPRKNASQTYDPRVLNTLSRRLSILITHKAQLLTAIRDLKRAHDNKDRIIELQAELKTIEAQIAEDFACAKSLSEQASIDVGKVRKEGFKLMLLHHTRAGYLFGGKPLPEWHTEYLDYTCPCCHERIRRTKRAIDAGSGIKLFALSCHCTSTLLNRRLSWPPEKVWARFVSEKKQDACPQIL